MFTDFYVTKNFKASELACKDENKTLYIDFQSVNKLQQLRDILGVPIIINSAFRTKEYNQQVKGAKNSKHLIGKAFDIRYTPELQKYGYDTIRRIAQNIGFNGVIIYDTFIHIDTRLALYFEDRRST